MIAALRRLPDLRAPRPAGDAADRAARGRRRRRAPAAHARPRRRAARLPRRAGLRDHPGEAEADFAVAFAQVSAPVMAKGVEDTAFYRYQPLGLPQRGGRRPGPLRPSGRRTSTRPWPTRPATGRRRCSPCRPTTPSAAATCGPGISVLSEMPDAWERAVDRWARANERYKQDGWPDRNAEYLLYQTLVGAWPIDAGAGRRLHGEGDQGGQGAHLLDRPERELRRRPSRASSRPSSPTRGSSPTWRRFLAEHRLVERGRVNSLAQTTLLLTCPGVPDLYQGTEVWDLSLVDPDNRRPVDYARPPPPAGRAVGRRARGGAGATATRAARSSGSSTGCCGTADAAPAAYGPARLRAAARRRARRPPRGGLPAAAGWPWWCRGWSPGWATGRRRPSTLPGGAWADVLTGEPVRRRRRRSVCRDLLPAVSRRGAGQGG